MNSDSIIIQLNWRGNHQAVSVRPVGLSCVEAVKDWVASLRRTNDPFQIVGLKNLSSGEIIWASELPDGLGSGIPQSQLCPGGEYEVVVGGGTSSSTVLPARLPHPNDTAPVFVESTLSAPYHLEHAPVFMEQTCVPVLEPALHSQLYSEHCQGYDSGCCKVYPVCHPVHGGLDSTGLEKRITNVTVYYKDEFGNRVSSPEAAMAGLGHQDSQLSDDYLPGPKGRRRQSRSRSRARSESPGRHYATSDPGSDVWDRLSQPKAPYEPAPMSSRSQQSQRSYRSAAERQEAKERLLMPRNQDYDDEEQLQGSGTFDPNLRTVYRKMTPEDLDLFVQRMYVPYKHPAPRRDVYDEHKEAEKRMYSFRDEAPANKPPMNFRRGHGPIVEDEEPPLAPVKLNDSDRQVAHNRLYESAKQKRERQKLREEEKEKAETPQVGSRKLTTEEMEALKKRLVKPKKVEVAADDDGHKVYGARPVPAGEMKKMVERLAKPKEHPNEAPPPAAFDKQKKVKLDYETYQKMLEKMSQPTERVRVEREKNPPGAKKEDDRRPAGANAPWSGVW